MSEVTQILSRIDSGDPRASAELLPLVYEEMRKLAAVRMAAESPDQTLQATALVHEAYLRLVGTGGSEQWASRGHFFSAAAEAMRRILVDNAHRKHTLKRGGQWQRVPLSDVNPAVLSPEDDIFALHEALDQLASLEPQTAELVKLRYFAGLTIQEAATALGVSPRKADAVWAYAKAWLHERISGGKVKE